MQDDRQYEYFINSLVKIQTIALHQHIMKNYYCFRTQIYYSDVRDHDLFITTLLYQESQIMAYVRSSFPREMMSGLHKFSELKKNQQATLVRRVTKRLNELIKSCDFVRETGTCNTEIFQYPDGFARNRALIDMAFVCSIKKMRVKLRNSLEQIPNDMEIQHNLAEQTYSKEIVHKLYTAVPMLREFIENNCRHHDAMNALLGLLIVEKQVIILPRKHVKKEQLALIHERCQKQVCHERFHCHKICTLNRQEMRKDWDKLLAQIIAICER